MTDITLTIRHPFFIIILIAICFAYENAQAGLIEKVIAVVNGEVITQTELDKEGEKVFARIKQSAPAGQVEELLTEAKKNILDQMIEELLVKQKAEELRIGISEEEIDSAVAKISSANNLSVEKLYQELGRTGVDKEDYREKLSKQLLQSKLVSYEIQSRIVISEKQARDYYDNAYTNEEIPKGYHLLQIGIPWGEQSSSIATRAKAKKRAESVRRQAVSGRDFRQLAESFSELPSAKAGGDIGSFKEDEMADSMRRIIINLRPGQISEIIEVGNSFQFFRLVSRNLDGTPEFAPYSDVKEIIIDRLRQEELEKRFKKWLEEIKEQAIIKKLI